MVTQLSTSLYDQCIADFEVRFVLGNPSETRQVLELRTTAFEHFKKAGFPSTRVEDWKYTNLAPFLKEDFLVEQDDLASADAREVERAGIPALKAYTIVLVNGIYIPQLSDSVIPDSVFIAPLLQAVHRPAFQEHFGQYTDVRKHQMAAINTALFNDGLYMEIKAKSAIERPIHIIHIHSADSPSFIQPRHLFVIGAGSQVSIIESYVGGSGSSKIFSNSVAEIVVADHSNLHHYLIQPGISSGSLVHHADVYQEASSVYNNYRASFPGTGLVRNNLNVTLDGERIESHLYGLYLAGGHQVVDNHTIVDHRQPHCQSNELYKGVMKDEAVAVFNGKIFVRRAAQKTNAFQQNNNLVLSRSAVIDSKPQLEIFADDVKCSHGSTVGQFNEEALFYLKSRGIGEVKAKALLIHAFVFDVTEKMGIPEVKAHVNHLIEQGLR